MGRYLNSRAPAESYREIAATRFFVDKTMLLEDILKAVEVDGQKYVCVGIGYSKKTKKHSCRVEAL